MNPLSPFTYYRRHKRSAMLQIALISLATVGLFILVAVLDTIPQRANVSYLTKLSRVIPIGGTLDPAAVSQIQTHPDVAQAIPDNGLRITMPTLLGTDSQQLLGVSPEDAQVLMRTCDVRIKEGRMFEPRTNEVVLSEEVARALNLELGSEIGRAIDQDHYSAIAAPLELVGILEGESEPSVRLGFVSSEYLGSHELYAPRATSLLVIAKDGRKDAVDDFLETTIRSKYTEVETFALLASTYRIARIGVYVIFGAVNSVVAIAVAFVVAIINQIAIAKRLEEFGLLYALGRHRRQLIRRLTLETATVAGLGYLFGLGIALAVMSWLKSGLFYDLGMELNLFNLAPFFFVLPIPLITVALTSLSVRRIFRRLDAVAIVEQGKLSEEPKGHRAVRGSSVRPLSSLTFYLRHRQRGVLTILSTALMVLGIAFPVFLFSAITSAMMPFMDYLQYASVVSPIHSELDPGVVGQIRSHPTVAHAIPAIPLSIQMILPPGGGTDTNIYGVSEADLPILLELFDVHVQKGRLPQPYSNELVLSAAIAANRDLHVGDVIGGKPNSDDPLVFDDLPTEMVVVGILSPDRPWIGFASYEYLHSHELTSSRNPRLLVIPHEGQKQALDRWLEETINSTQTRITLYDVQLRDYEEMTTSVVITFTLLECMIAAVAAVALATLNHIFFTQRREEFGTLNAMGRSRRWLVLRTLKETGSVIGLAWVAGAALCGIGLLGMQSLVYAPRGLTLDFFNLVPWLLTTPVPLAVALASVGTIAWMLSRLDPVAVIERR
ncbi:MAG: FtsX-like permease family protein [Anaerolineae bacterium]|jgi:ABC-type lipoprotein release transport system permease subunit